MSNDIGYSTAELRRLIPPWDGAHPDNHEPDDDRPDRDELAAEYNAILEGDCPACLAVDGVCAECDKRLQDLDQEMEEAP